MIIGFSGKIGTGKTTLTNHLMDILQERGINPVKLSFASMLREEASAIYGFSIEDSYNNKNMVIDIDPKLPNELISKNWKGNKASIREILQFYATDVIRAKNPDYWVEELAKKIEKMPDAIIFIDDVRFPNEKKFIENNGICIRINQYPDYVVTSDHASETALDNAEFQYFVSPKFGELKETANELINNIQNLVQKNNFSLNP